MTTRLLVAAVAVLAAAGCGSNLTTDGGPTTYTCDPPCPKGVACTATGCASPDGSAVAGDLGMGDMAAPACSPPCAAPTPYCNGNKVCVPCVMDSHCPMGQVCHAVGTTGACVPGCTDDSRCAAPAKCCGGQCTDVTKDALNCGACGTACNATHASASCTGGMCAAGMCRPGWADCNMDPKDGCEVKLDFDVNNCGACGTVCKIPNATAGCGPAPMGMSGCYLQACTYGFDDCNGDVKDGCETSVTSDVKNCGGCGMVCPPVAHATVGCVNAVCGLISCQQGWSDCDGNAKNGCEVQTNSDIKNCGKCGAACGMGQVCINSSCTCANCNINNAKTKCVNNACVFDQCLPNFGDCNNNLNDGCEADLTSDNNNCSACGNACPNNAPNCQNGVCTNLWQPDGVQQNVPVNMLAGWSLCYNDTYNVPLGGQIQNIKGKCTGNKLLLACRRNNSQTLTLLAAGNAADVFFDTGQGGQGHVAGKVVWYFNANWAWGFATAGDQLSLNECDTNGGNDRLCWHTCCNAGGYRCGGTTGLNGDASWDRLVYQAN
jgi:hypothetical protein